MPNQYFLTTNTQGFFSNTTRTLPQPFGGHPIPQAGWSQEMRLLGLQSPDSLTNLESPDSGHS